MNTLGRFSFNTIERKYPNYIGYLYALICHFSFVIMGSMIQRSSKRLRTYQVINAFGITLAFFNYANLQHKKVLPCSKKPKTNRLMILRACVGPLGAISMTVGLSMLPLSEATALQMTTPVITAILAIFILKEKFDMMIFINSIFSFVGVLFIAKPSFLFDDNSGIVYENRTLGVLIILFGSFAGAFIQIILKKLNPLSNPFSISFHFGLILSGIAGIGQIVQGVKDVEIVDLITLAGVGLLNFTSLLLLTKSYGFGDAGKISLMFYTQVLFAYMIEIVIDRIIPDTYSFIGSVFIFSSVFVMLYRIHRQKKTAK